MLYFDLQVEFIQILHYAITVSNCPMTDKYTQEIILFWNCSNIHIENNRLVPWMEKFIW